MSEAPGPAATPDAYFHRMWSMGDDPWAHGTRWYEARKYHLTVAALPRRRYRRAFEPGCGAGYLTALLAPRVDRLVASDRSPQAVGVTRRRCADLVGVGVTEGRLPDDWPGGTFDLIVLSEVLYYLDDPQLDLALAQTIGSLDPHGHVIAVHYRRPVTEHARLGDDVHERLDDALPGVLVRHVEDDFILEARDRVTTASPPIRRVVVGIPARDEGATIAACLTAVVAAANGVRVPVHVVVADDGSVDDTASLARSTLSHASAQSFQVIGGRFDSAGAARASALDAGIEAVGGDLRATWLATTDADSLVAPDWLVHHLRWADAGLEAIAGLVDVAWRPDQQHLARRYAVALARTGTVTGHHHVHGANLGVRANRWAQVGGCGTGDDGEDGELWRRLRAAGVATLGVTDLHVRTSGRLHGRAPRGFSGYLRAIDPGHGVG